MDGSTSEKGPVDNQGKKESAEAKPKGFQIRIESPDLILNAAQKGKSGELGKSLLEKPIKSIDVKLLSGKGNFDLEASVGLDTLAGWDGDNNEDKTKLRTLDFRKDIAEEFGTYKERSNNYIITGPRGTPLVITEELSLNKCIITTGFVRDWSRRIERINPAPESTKENVENALADVSDVIKRSVSTIYGLALKPVPNEELVLHPPKVKTDEVGEYSTPEALLGKLNVEKPDIKFEDIGGQEGAKREIQGLAFALKNPELYRKWGTKPPKGILLYGPPGTGKTLLAKALASQADAQFLHVQASDIASKWYGDSEKIMKDIFELASKSDGKAIIFFDEIDAILQKREGAHEATQRVVSTFLENMDGLSKNDNVIVVASTNRKDSIEPAALRAGRFDRWVEVPMPDGEGRKQIINIHMGNAEKIAGRKLFKDIDIGQLAAKTEGFNGADIAEVLRRVLEEKVRLEGTMGFDPNPVETENITSELEYYEKKNKQGNG